MRGRCWIAVAALALGAGPLAAGEPRATAVQIGLVPTGESAPSPVLVPVPKGRKPRVPGRGKGKIWIGPHFEFTDEEITELFEGPL